MAPNKGLAELESLDRVDESQHEGQPGLSHQANNVDAPESTIQVIEPANHEPPDSILSGKPTTTPLPPHLDHDPLTNAKRSDPFQFGQRFLADSDDPFTFNAWDHVEPDAEYLEYCSSQYEKQRQSPLSEFDKSRINANPAKWWDTFYRQKTSTFFKDRKWLVQEFPILSEITRAGSGRKRVLEVGAGAGNTAFPIVRMNENPDLHVYAYDFSKKAVETMRSSPDYDENLVTADVWDVASTEHEGRPPGIEAGSLDVVILIFIFSALSPSQWTQAVRNIGHILKPGGVVLFRDYGRGDLAQVRFKAGRWMEENFYVRGDGTRVYFFEVDELRRIWGGGKVDKEGTSDETKNEKPQDVQEEAEVERTKFEILDLDVDRRMIVNRQRKIKMYRCWIQGRFQKLDADTLEAS